MYQDPIVAAIHQYREEYARSLNYDLNAIFQDLRKKQVASNRTFIRLPIKRFVNAGGVSPKPKATCERKN